jgi:hypothetical protein
MTSSDQKISEDAMKLIKVPRAFHDDHLSRSDDSEDAPATDPVRYTKAHVYLRADDPGIPDLLDDARHYADPSWSLDPAYFGLKRSAVATVKALEESAK